jgi:hypothetical protein
VGRETVNERIAQFSERNDRFRCDVFAIELIDVGVSDPALQDDALPTEASAGFANPGLRELADEGVDTRRSALFIRADEDCVISPSSDGVTVRNGCPSSTL